MSRVREWLLERGLSAEFESVHGEKEDYQRAVIGSATGPVEVFVYADEAGVMSSDKKWRICERWDFSDDDELIARFLEVVADEVEPRPRATPSR